jgi:uncharacterized protein YndB with AHSA1/START domain
MTARQPAETTTTKNETTVQIASDRELVISRTFNARPAVVFDAWTRADLVKRWWAPARLDVEVVSVDADVRVGGAYRYVLRKRGDAPFAFSGEYREVTPASRLVYTQIFEPMREAGAVVVTVTFADVGGRTALVSRERYPSKEALDVTLATGMEGGMRETMDQLDALVASLADS